MTDVSTKDTLMEALGIKFLEYSKERVVATMPVNNKTRQSYGMLHGGASVALAESVASMGAWYLVNREKEYVLGLEINANHVRGKKDGIVTAVGTPVHVGRTTMVWDVRIVDEEEKLISISRCTMAVRQIEE